MLIDARKMMTWRVLGLALLLALSGPATSMEDEDQQILPAGTIRHSAASLSWVDAPPSMPKGTKIAVLEGDPAQAELFSLRVSVPAGARLPPHWHPRDERVTILSGRVGVGFGDDFDERRLHYFSPGDYYVNPAHSHHYVFFPEASIVQITGSGPWQTQLLPSQAPGSPAIQQR